MRAAARGRVTSLPPLREVIARHGLSASRALGQNFILDEQLLDRVAAIPGPIEGERVYEVGPGPGGLTRALLRAGAQVIAVERDRRCLAPLRELADFFPGSLQIVEGDAMAQDEACLAQGSHVVANLPYNVGTALLVRWLSAEWPPWWKTLTLMFQREVAERIVARPGSPGFSRLSVLAQWRSTARIAMKVHRSAFVPPPQVMSAVVHLAPVDPPEGVDFADLEKLTAAAFGQRRKMLRRSLQNLPEALDAMERLGIDPERRAETLQVADFVAIARLMGKDGSSPLPA